MPRKRDSFDGMADAFRAYPEGVMKTALVLQAIYDLPKEATAEDVMTLMRAIRRDLAPFVVAAALRGAAERPLAPSEGPVNLNVVAYRIVLRQRVAAVVYALKADRLAKWKNDEALVKAAATFPAPRREAALAAMKRCRGGRDRVTNGLASRIVLETLGRPATVEDGKALLRQLLRGPAKREEKLIGPSVLISLEGPGEALLSSIAAATPESGRSKRTPP